MPRCFRKNALLLATTLLIARAGGQDSRIQERSFAPDAMASSAASAQQIKDLFCSQAFKAHILKSPSGLLRHNYLVPDGPYHEAYDWDTYFMGVALSYYDNGKPLADSVQNFLDYVNENGYTPRVIEPGGFRNLPEMAKPFLAQGALRASRDLKDFEWVRPYYPKLGATLAFWENSRRSADELFRWYNAVESGVDNNPAVSSRPSEVTEGVDLQCYLYREYLAMAVIATNLGKVDEANGFATSAARLKKTVQTRMWSEEQGTFFNLDSRTGKRIPIETWTNFVPLWANIASEQQAQRMIARHLLNSREFWSRHGVRTLSRTEPLYNATSGYWRGPVWIISNYLVMHGLLNYGYRGAARELAAETVLLLIGDMKKGGGMNECYDSETGAPVANGHFVSWNLLAEHMIEESESSYDPTSISPDDETAPALAGNHHSSSQVD